MSLGAAEITPVKIEFDDLGFVKGYVCPNCGGKLRIHLISQNTVFYQCELCGCISQKPLIPEAKVQLLSSLRELQCELTVEDIRRILDTTIKFDDNNKVICFLAFLTVYTNEDQINLGFIAESSTGKSYIPLEVAAYFPEEDVIELGYASPTAFFHDWGVLERDEEGRIQNVVINLERKILIFLDQPHPELLERLRPVLSHDKKVIEFRITDKSDKYGLRTKNIKIIGFPVAVFCSANPNLDEQENTRLLLLSPERTQDKLREALNLRLLRESDRAAFRKYLEEDESRRFLMKRINLIKNSGVREVIIPESLREEIKTRFLREHTFLKPRHIRDLSRLVSLVKAHALLNYPNREREGETIKANLTDVEAAFKLYMGISAANDLGLSPWLFEIYRLIASNAPEGATITDFQSLYFQHYHQALGYKKAYSILKTLLSAGLLTEETSPEDRRKLLYKPLKYFSLDLGATSTPCDLTYQIKNNEANEAGGLNNSNEGDSKNIFSSRWGYLPPGAGKNIFDVFRELPTEPGVFFYQRIPPAEPCELCGAHPVEYIIKTDDGTVLRRCPSCFREMRNMFIKVRWVEVGVSGLE